MDKKNKKTLMIILAIIVFLAIVGFFVFKARNNQENILGERDFQNIDSCKTGDVNCDGKINMTDFKLFREDFQRYEQYGWSKDLSRSDFNNDQRIDDLDYEIFKDFPKDF